MRKYLIYLTSALLLAACSQEMEIRETGCKLNSLSVSVEPYVGETATRANLDGKGFENGDWIRLKIICPFAQESQVGENTHSGSSNAFWLMKYAGNGQLTNLKTEDGCDIDGDFRPSNSSSINGLYLSQQTPYVFVAQTWNEEKVFYYGSTRYLQYSYTFQADQSKADGSAYKKNDLLWAQQFMQTGTPNVHLTFSHKMAALKITVDDSALDKQISSDAVLTLEGMPDIDQMEVAIGDYYAAKDESTTAFGYKQQTSCSKEYNGNVLGVVVINHSQGIAETKSIASISEEGIYKAYHDTDDTENIVYRLIVPPCTVTNPVFYLRDGNRRFKVVLSQKTFKQGYLYPIKLTVTKPDPVLP